MKVILIIFFSLTTAALQAQKVDSICFHLYTDSLKKGVYNYINVDGKLHNGRYLPLMTDEILLTSTAGKWDGNSLILDKGSKTDSVVITATLKKQPEMKRTVTIYVKKIETEPELKTEAELLKEWRKKGSNRNK